MHPQAKMETLDEIIAMMDDAQMKRIPGKEPAGVKMEKQSLELGSAMGAESPAELAEDSLSGDPMMGEESDMSDEDLQALMAMYGGEEEEEAY